MFNHFGEEKKTVGSSSAKHNIGTQYGQDLDMRGIVGIVSRNIKIQGSGSWLGGWGCRVYITDWI
jgi:hypothetical protein